MLSRNSIRRDAEFLSLHCQRSGRRFPSKKTIASCDYRPPDTADDSRRTLRRLQQLETLIDEYCEAQSLDPSRLPMIRDRILALTNKENLDKDLGIQLNKSEFTEFITRTDGYLCELKESQIRDGLHIFGQCPEGRQLRDLIIAIARHPTNGRSGITRALAEDLDLRFRPVNLRSDLKNSAPHSGRFSRRTRRKSR